MLTRRERKHATIAVTGDIPLDARIPRWESELLIAALDRLEEKRRCGERDERRAEEQSEFHHNGSKRAVGKMAGCGARLGKIASGWRNIVRPSRLRLVRRLRMR